MTSSLAPSDVKCNQYNANYIHKIFPLPKGRVITIHSSNKKKVKTTQFLCPVGTYSSKAVRPSISTLEFVTKCKGEKLRKQRKFCERRKHWFCGIPCTILHGSHLAFTYVHIYLKYIYIFYRQYIYTYLQHPTIQIYKISLPVLDVLSPGPLRVKSTYKNLTIFKCLKAKGVSIQHSCLHFGDLNVLTEIRCFTMDSPGTYWSKDRLNISQINIVVNINGLFIDTLLE